MLVNSHVTPLSLYSILFQHRGRAVIFLDDVDSMFRSMAAPGSAAVVPVGPSEGGDLRVEPIAQGFAARIRVHQQVHFRGQRDPRKNDAFKAVLSRCDIFELSATNEEVLDLMRCVVVAGFPGRDTDDCTMVIDFIAENSEDHQLSMRLLGPSLRKLQYARIARVWIGDRWSESQLQALGRKQQATKRLDSRTRDLRIVAGGAKTSSPICVKDQMAYFCSHTQKSRASFYRALAQVKEELG